MASRFRLTPDANLERLHADVEDADCDCPAAEMTALGEHTQRVRIAHTSFALENEGILEDDFIMEVNDAPLPPNMTQRDFVDFWAKQEAPLSLVLWSAPPPHEYDEVLVWWDPEDDDVKILPDKDRLNHSRWARPKSYLGVTITTDVSGVVDANLRTASFTAHANASPQNTEEGREYGACAVIRDVHSVGSSLYEGDIIIGFHNMPLPRNITELDLQRILANHAPKFVNVWRSRQLAIDRIMETENGGQGRNTVSSPHSSLSEHEFMDDMDTPSGLKSATSSSSSLRRAGGSASQLSEVNSPPSSLFYMFSQLVGGAEGETPKSSRRRSLRSPRASNASMSKTSMMTSDSQKSSGTAVTPSKLRKEVEIFFSDILLRRKLYDTLDVGSEWVFEKCRWVNFVKCGYKFITISKTRRPSSWACHDVPERSSEAYRRHSSGSIGSASMQSSLATGVGGFVDRKNVILLTENSMFLLWARSIFEPVPARNPRSQSFAAPPSPVSPTRNGGASAAAEVSPKPVEAKKAKRRSRLSVWKHLPFVKKKSKHKRHSIDNSGLQPQQQPNEASQQHQHGDDGDMTPRSPLTPPSALGSATEQAMDIDPNEWSYGKSVRLDPQHIQTAVIVHRRKVLDSGDEVAVRSSDLILILTKAATRRFFGDSSEDARKAGDGVDGPGDEILSAEDISAQLVDDDDDDDDDDTTNVVAPPRAADAALGEVMKRHRLRTPTPTNPADDGDDRDSFASLDRSASMRSFSSTGSFGPEKFKRRAEIFLTFPSNLHRSEFLDVFQEWYGDEDLEITETMAPVNAAMNEAAGVPRSFFTNANVD